MHDDGPPPGNAGTLGRWPGTGCGARAKARASGRPLYAIAQALRPLPSSNLKRNTLPRMRTDRFSTRKGAAVGRRYLHLSTEERIVIEKMGAEGKSIWEKMGAGH